MRRMRVMGVVALGLAVVVACESPAPERVEIAADTSETGIGFELAGPGGAALLVPVYVNGGGPYSFVLDTGATMTCVDRSLAERLDLPEARGGGVGVGVGQAGELQLVAVDSLRVGEATAVDMMACSLDLEQLREVGIEVEGLLGLNYLQEFRVTLDFPSRRLTLRR